MHVPGTIDSHVHFWDPGRLDYSWLAGEPDLSRRFTPDDLDTGGVALEGLVFVQADCRAEQAAEEVAWVRSLAEAGTPVLGIVAHAPLETGRACRAVLATYSADPLVVGVRRLVQDEPPGFALGPEFVEAVRLLPDFGLSLDLCVRAHQLGEVTRLVEMCPDVTFVLDHLGKPPVTGDDLGPWADDLARLAELPHVSCKLSGLASEATPPARTSRVLLPYLEHALDAFGPDRCLFGSDWPVSRPVVDYRAWHDLVVGACARWGPDGRAQVLSGNARRIYGLPTQEGGQ